MPNQWGMTVQEYEIARRSIIDEAYQRSLIAVAHPNIEQQHEALRLVGEWRKEREKELYEKYREGKPWSENHPDHDEAWERGKVINLFGIGRDYE